MEIKEMTKKKEKLCKILIAILSIFNILGCVMIKFINGDSLLILAFLLGIVWLLMLVVFFKLNDYCYEIYLTEEQKNVKTIKPIKQIILGIIYSVFMIIYVFKCF